MLDIISAAFAPIITEVVGVIVTVLVGYWPPLPIASVRPMPFQAQWIALLPTSLHAQL